MASLFVMQSAASLIEPPPQTAPANSPAGVLGDSTGGASGQTQIELGGAAAGDSRVRDGLLEVPRDSLVSVLVRLDTEPISSIILYYRERAGPQERWSPAVAEEVREAVAQRTAALERERTAVLGPLRAAGFSAEPTRDYRYLVNGINLRDLPAAAVPLLAADPRVATVELDREVHVDLTQSVPLINADDVWALHDASGHNITGEGSVIANIDTGVDYTHPDLGGTLNRTSDFANFTAGTHTKFVGGWDFVNNDNDPWDDHFHGTHVAGIIGANGTLRGVAPGSKQLALKVLSGSGYGSDSDIIAAMEYATNPDRDPLTDDGADASSMSLGGWDPNPDGIEPIAADTSTRLGTLCVIAAGNSGETSSIGSPGVSRESITVGSTTKSDQLSGFSSRGPTLGFDIKPDLVAPGSSIVSARNGGVGGNTTLSGTSMATPHVSGAVALLRQAHPTWTVAELKSALVNTAKDLGYGVFQQGGGRLDTLAAVNTPLSAYPHKLAIGKLSRQAGPTNATVVLENTGNATLILNLSARDVFGMYPAMTFVNNNTDLNFVNVTPALLTMAPGARKTVTVTFAPPATAAAGHYWGSVNATSGNFTLSVPFAYYVRAPILLVDDDSSDRWSNAPPFDNYAGFPSASNNVSWALGRPGIAHDIYTAVHYTPDGPDLVELLNYPVVIWATGYDYDYSDADHRHYSLSVRDRQALAAYLDNGGQLWLIGENIAWELFGHANATVPAAHFLNAYLGVGRIANELNTPNPLNGSSGTFMAGASYATAADWNDYDNNGDFATNLTPTSRGFTLLNGSTTDIYGLSYPNASLAVAVNNTTYRSVYWGLEFSWLRNNTNFDDAVNRTLNFFNRSRNLTLPANDLAVEVLVDPYKSDWLPLFAADWSRPFDDLGHAGTAFNVTVSVRNLGTAAQTNVTVNVTLLDNTTAAQQSATLTFASVPALTNVSQHVQITPRKHGYFTVNASMNRSDANASNNADGSGLLVPNFEDEADNATAWNATGNWRATTGGWYSPSKSFVVGVTDSANDTLTSPLLDLTRVNTSSIAGSARLYFEMAGVISGSDALYVETRNVSNATWVTQRTLTAYNSPSAFTYFLQGTDLSNLANNSGYFRLRFVTGLASSSYFYADHFVVWTYHERGQALDPQVTVTNATRSEGQALDFRGSHGNPQSSSSFTYLWNFGDGTSASSRNATHAFVDDGLYFVRYSVNDGLGLNETALLPLAVTNAAPVVAAAAASPDPASEGANVTFTGSCSDPGALDNLTLTWTFGDGGSTASASPVNHVFADEGPYSYLAQCADGDGGVATVNRTINITNVAPTVTSMNATANMTDEGSVAAFSGACTDPGALDVLTLNWSFGDGTANGTGASVNHTYADEGNYTVTLVCSDGDGGSNASTRTQTVRNVAPSVNSTSTSANPSDEGAPVNLTATCADPGTLDSITFSWNFGDGTVNVTGATPNHTFANQGNYTVTVTCSDGDGGTALSSWLQAVRNVAPFVSAVGVTGALLEGTNLSFASQCFDNGTLDSLTYSWDFGDGTPLASGGSRTHAYLDDGTYTALLTCSDGDGGVVTRQLLLLIANVAPTVTLTGPNATMEGTSVFFGSTVTDPGVLDTFSYALDFGDGTPIATTATATHVFAENGVYTVVLSVRDSDAGVGQATLVVVVANVAPTANLSVAGPRVEGEALVFTPAVTDPGLADSFSYAWDFGDGSVSSLPSPTHAYADEGSYLVTLRVTDNDLGQGVATLTLSLSNVAPTLTLASGDTAALEGANASFTVTAHDPGTVDQLFLAVSFGDGSADLTVPSAGPNTDFTHAFPNEGTYTIRATLSDGDGGTNLSSLNLTVLNAAPTLLVEASAGVVDENGTVTFSALASDAGVHDVLTVTWQFSDSAENSAGLVVERTYRNEGTYLINATVTDDAGAHATIGLTVVVHNVAPTLSVDLPAQLGEGRPLSFTAHVSDPGPDDVVRVHWEWGDGTSSEGTAVEHTYANIGNYSLLVTATDDAGAPATQVFTLTVQNLPPPLAFVRVTNPRVEGNLLEFEAYFEPELFESVAYRWDFGDGSTSTLASPAHTYLDDGHFALTLEVRDPEGAVATYGITVNIANSAPNITCQRCPSDVLVGATVSVRARATDAGVRDVLSYSLEFPNGTTLASPDGSFDFTFEAAGSPSLRLRVSDGDGATQELLINMTVRPDFDHDGIDDAADPDDDNDGVPDASDPAPFDAAVGQTKVSTPADAGFGLILILGLLAAGGVLVAVLRRRRRRV